MTIAVKVLVKSCESYSVNSIDDDSVISVKVNDEISKKEKKILVTDSDCSNGLPLRTTATVARSFLQVVMQNRNGNVHEGRKSLIKKPLIYSKKSCIEIRVKIINTIERL